MDRWFRFVRQQIQMASIREVYSLVNRASAHGIEGYHVDKKYVDHMKLKYERELSKSKEQARKPQNVSKKTSFIDEAVKNQSTLPGPCTYEPKQLVPKSKTENLVAVPRRQTIFDEMEHQLKKANYPAAGIYDKVQIETDRTRLKSDLSKADKSNYIDSSMRNSLESPGVGNYNSYHNEDKRAAKWVGEKEKKVGSKSVRLPPVGTYSPHPVAYQLFQNELAAQRRYRSYFNREQRFKKSKEKAIPYYEVLSEWGLKNKRVKKDILSRISSPSAQQRSVYR